MSLGPELLFVQADEINKSLSNNRVRKAEAGDRWLALIFSSDRSLFFSWDSDFYGCSTVWPAEIRGLSEIAKNRPTILSAVKSHIVGANLIAARARYRDRVLSIEFHKTIGAGFYQTKHLLLEASGKYSNLMLLDEDEKILEAAKHIHADTNRYRSTLPGLSYTPPPPLAGIQLEDFDFNDGDASAKLEKIVGVGRPLLQALQKACMEAPERRGEILRGLDHFKKGGAWRGEARYFSLGGYVTLYPHALSEAISIDSPDALEAARATVVSPLILRAAEAEKKKLLRVLNRENAVNAKKIRDAEASLASADKAEKNLLHGRLILANAWAIPPRADAANLSEWTDGGEVKHRVALDPEKDAPSNAERYFARYRKLKASAAHAAKTLSPLYAKNDELQERIVLLERQNDLTTLALTALEIEEAKFKPSKTKSKKNAKPAPLAPHARYELVGATLCVGLSAKGNHYVTFRLATPDDIWLHAQQIPGAHVILRFEGDPGEEAESEALALAAACAAHYSKGRETRHVRVDYTRRKHVRAIPGGGLAHVTYKEFRTVMADVSLWEKRLAEKDALMRGCRY